MRETGWHLPRIGPCTAVLAGLALAACSMVPMQPKPGPAVATITLVKRSWHTDVCLRTDDAGPQVLPFTKGFDGTRFLCFGFGEQQYVLTRTHTPLDALAALFPSPAAVLMTALRGTPAEAFGASAVTDLDVSREGLVGLQGFLSRSVKHDALGQPVPLGAGPYPGSLFFVATGTYHALYTCNAWTADALRAAGMPLPGRPLFSGELVYDVRQMGGQAYATADPQVSVAP